MCKFLIFGARTILIWQCFAIQTAAPQEKLRVIVETDAGGDPDDEQSLVRFLLYANEWDIEGIIANRPTARPNENLNSVRTGLAIVQQQLSAYGEVWPRLTENAPGYPSKQYLWDRTVAGYEDTDAAVDLIIAAVDRDDARPVWYQNWGTDHGSAPSNLKRALDKVLAERGPTEYAKFKDRVLLCSDNQFGEHTSQHQPPWRFWLQPTRPKLDGAFMYHRFGPITATAGGFDIERDVRTGHGPLGALYPTNTNIRQKEGDSAYFLYLVPTGMNDPMQPTWGSWAGRFGNRDDQQSVPKGWYWANVTDKWRDETNRDNTLLRWAADLQNDFRARLDWCIMSVAEANHPPIAALNGDTSKEILTVTAQPRSVVMLNADASSDMDHDMLTYSWFVYPEASTYPNAVTLTNPDHAVTQLNVPDDADGKSIHAVVAVHDNGDPPLAAYRRVIIQVQQ